MGIQAGKRAVVLGGSVAGLLAARVLAESFAEVLVVERDGLPDEPAPRRGVPQGRHAHGLLARGHQVLEELFPGFTGDLRAAGALTGDLGELHWYFHGRRLRPARTGLVAVAATRPLLEGLIRARVGALANVALLDRCEVTGLAATPGRRAVTGARILRREGAAPAETVLDADLVVDATGRGSRTAAHLRGLGYRPPAEDRVRIDLTYTTRHYRLGAGRMPAGVQSINPVSGPVTPRGAFFSELEDGLFVLSLTGVLGDRAPTDPDGFAAFVRSLPVPDVHDIVGDAEPLDAPVAFRFPASVRRRYERLERFPAGLLVVGDAVCSFNPVYGQGMTVAALEALALRGHLRSGAIPEPRRFFRDISVIIDVAWDISAGGDLAFPGVDGRRTLRTRVGNAYIARLHAAAARDPELTRAFMRVAGLVDPPRALTRPGVLLRVLRGGGAAGKDLPAGAGAAAADHSSA
ncbi:FAD-dependent oxidoreductase [Actinomadura fibrosa]|uniref:FAD-dependent oxidoreductase n=1 Tax=Actinomadura fibrosa TaxID=111802 RepID=A0ABW2Y341_9ACTN|nr:FAD-binding monooxygenase [Actinomadura fibrosa]